MIALFIVPIVLVAFVFFYLGKNQERIEWNKLIKDGILPKPLNNKNNEKISKTTSRGNRIR
jgi:hypothetical protein